MAVYETWMGTTTSMLQGRQGSLGVYATWCDVCALGMGTLPSSGGPFPKPGGADNSMSPF